MVFFGKASMADRMICGRLYDRRGGIENAGNDERGAR